MSRAARPASATAGTEDAIVPDAAACVWRTASASENTECVEVSSAGSRVLIRDSKDVASGVIAVPRRVFGELVARLRDE
ncbi:DUF397 domain-containing protein [Spirillospora albida]|uniref:DUF397 domain-containing protein n=1 Tax=Spirillospora albida TaxID=58123 RepID=UPI0004BEE0F8|nr:DUF397 domain-containing protein [Spirillospora albida]